MIPQNFNRSTIVAMEHNGIGLYAVRHKTTKDDTKHNSNNFKIFLAWKILN